MGEGITCVMGTSTITLSQEDDVYYGLTKGGKNSTIILKLG